jgi:hypothetical protein
MSDDKNTENTGSKAKKLTKVQEQSLKVQELEARLAKVEKKQVIMTDGYKFAANEIRPLFGFGAIALIFDAIYDKLVK